MLPGVDLDRFTPVSAAHARRARQHFGFPADAYVVAFVGRIQPLKAPDVLLRAAAELRLRDPEIGRRLVVAICGGPSGSGLERPTALMDLAAELGIADAVRFLPPQPRDDLAELYRAVDVVAVPSHNESFGLVALEAQACGTPVVAAAVGGLVTAVRDGVSGVLVDSHAPGRLGARARAALLGAPQLRRRLAGGRGRARPRVLLDAHGQRPARRVPGCLQRAAATAVAGGFLVTRRCVDRAGLRRPGAAL